MALAPDARLVLGAVGSISTRSTRLLLAVETQQRFANFGVDVFDGLLHALCRDNGPSPSRSRSASREPVEAPLGTAARPVAPLSSTTSASTVGLPRELKNFTGDDVNNGAHKFPCL